MIIKTNLSWNTLATYSALMWNNGRDDYTADGDNFIECIDPDEENFVLKADFLRNEVEYSIESYYGMLDDDYNHVCHEDYLEGYRDERTIKGHKEYLKQRAEINAFKRQYKQWLPTIEEVAEWEYDTDEVEFIAFPREARGKAVPVLHEAC